MAFFTRAPLLFVALFAIAPLLCALDENEIEITVYIHQMVDGPTKNQANVIPGSDGIFGRTAVLDWAIRKVPDTNAKVIGHARGFHMNTNPTYYDRTWYTFLNLEFSDETVYNGSTLQVIGFTHRANEWSIVGGTGQFTMARGVAKYTIEAETNNPLSRIYSVNVHAYYSSMGSRAVSDKSSYNSKISGPIAVN